MYRTQGSSAIAYYQYQGEEDDSVQFFDDLWADSNPEYTENVCLKSGKRFISRSISLIREQNPTTAEGLGRFASGMWGDDLMYTPNTFKPCGGSSGSNRAGNMFAIYAFAVDVDYKQTMTEKEIVAINAEHSMLKHFLPIREYYLHYRIEPTVYSGSPRYFYDCLAEEFEYLRIPPPSYIETGHQLRMIYLLSDPVSCSGKSAARTKRLVKAVQKHICNALNGYFGCGAEIQVLNGYFRMPSSKNTKDGSTVRIWKASGKKYDLGWLKEEYLPDLPLEPEEYRASKKRSKKKRRRDVTLTGKGEGKVVPLHNAFTLCQNRMECFCELRTYAEENHRREILTFLYVATALTIEPDQDPVTLAENFGTGFRNPIGPNELRWRFRTAKPYFFKTETIAEKLGLTVQDLEEYGLRVNQRQKEWQEKVSRGETRAQKADAHYREFCALQEKGLSKREIAKEMGMSEESIKAYRKKLRREKEESSQKDREPLKDPAG